MKCFLIVSTIAAPTIYVMHRVLTHVGEAQQQRLLFPSALLAFQKNMPFSILVLKHISGFSSDMATSPTRRKEIEAGIETENTSEGENFRTGKSKGRDIACDSSEAALRRKCLSAVPSKVAATWASERVQPSQSTRSSTLDLTCAGRVPKRGHRHDMPSAGSAADRAAVRSLRFSSEDRSNQGTVEVDSESGFSGSPSPDSMPVGRKLPSALGQRASRPAGRAPSRLEGAAGSRANAPLHRHPPSHATLQRRRRLANAAEAALASSPSKPSMRHSSSRGPSGILPANKYKLGGTSVHGDGLVETRHPGLSGSRNQRGSSPSSFSSSPSKLGSPQVPQCSKHRTTQVSPDYLSSSVESLNKHTQARCSDGSSSGAEEESRHAGQGENFQGSLGVGFNSDSGETRGKSGNTICEANLQPQDQFNHNGSISSGRRMESFTTTNKTERSTPAATRCGTNNELCDSSDAEGGENGSEGRRQLSVDMSSGELSEDFASPSELQLSSLSFRRSAPRQEKPYKHSHCGTGVDGLLGTSSDIRVVPVINRSETAFDESGKCNIVFKNGASFSEKQRRRRRQSGDAMVSSLSPRSAVKRGEPSGPHMSSGLTGSSASDSTLGSESCSDGELRSSSGKSDFSSGFHGSEDARHDYSKRPSREGVNGPQERGMNDGRLSGLLRKNSVTLFEEVGDEADWTTTESGLHNEGLSSGCGNSQPFFNASSLLHGGQQQIQRSNGEVCAGGFAGARKSPRDGGWTDVSATPTGRSPSTSDVLYSTKKSSSDELETNTGNFHIGSQHQPAYADVVEPLQPVVGQQKQNPPQRSRASAATSWFRPTASSALSASGSGEPSTARPATASSAAALFVAPFAAVADTAAALRNTNLVAASSRCSKRSAPKTSRSTKTAIHATGAAAAESTASNPAATDSAATDRKAAVKGATATSARMSGAASRRMFSSAQSSISSNTEPTAR